MKTCRICSQEKPLTEFYKKSDMRDGHLSLCKKCHKERSVSWQKENKERVNENSRKRAKTEEVKARRKKQYTSEQGRKNAREAVKRYRQKKPMVDVAHRFIRLAIAKGLIKRETSCSECASAETIEAHHDDYTKPDVIRWLCKSCHETWHRFNKPIYQKSPEEGIEK